MSILTKSANLKRLKYQYNFNQQSESLAQYIRAMKTFDFYQDRKVTCWERTQFSIEAESYKEALEIIKSWEGEDVLCFEDDKQIMVTDGETLYETSEAISPIDNGGRPTIEVFDSTGNKITDNVMKTRL